VATVELPYGSGCLTFEIPNDSLGEIVSPRRIATGSGTDAIIRYALDHPVGTPLLSEMLRPEQNVAIIIDDISRETPTAHMLPPLLEVLAMAGIETTHVSIIIALGTHRTMTETEIAVKVGAEILKTYRVFNTPCEDERHMVYVGTSSNGIPAWIHRAVAEADIRIAVGMICPHMDTGFSGGAKIILPGVCSRQTVNEFHARQASLSGNQLGVIDAPMRHDLETFVGGRVGLDFILNAVLNRDGTLYRCVAGHYIQAHRRGIDFAKEIYGVPVARRYPLVISNAFPAQIDLWQSTKGIASGELMTLDRGTLILVTHCREGNSTHPLLAEYLKQTPEQLLGEPGARNAEDPVAYAVAVPISRIRERVKICLVSSGLTASDANRIGFTYYKTIGEAIRTELEGHGSEQRVGVLTHGGVTLPLIGSAQPAE
jgi:nickel-dependent lactate racemase